MQNTPFMLCFSTLYNTVAISLLEYSIYFQVITIFVIYLRCFSQFPP
jgi:hypothetical protein